MVAYLGFEAEAQRRATVSYYSTQGFHSAGGQSLALQLVDSLSATGVLGAVTVAGMRLPMLRETRMTAVVCSLGPIQRVTDNAGVVADAIVTVLGAVVFLFHLDDLIGARPGPHGRTPPALHDAAEQGVRGVFRVVHRLVHCLCVHLTFTQMNI